MADSEFEIMQYSLCEGWVNNLYDGNDRPYVFISLEEAIAELQEEFDDWQAEIETGHRDEEDGYDIATFQIVCNITGIAYELVYQEGVISVARGFTYH